MRNLKAPAAIALAVVLSAPAIAGVNLEYGQEYEAAYLELCQRDHGEEPCACSMEMLEQQIGFERFAEEMNRYRHDPNGDSPISISVTDLTEECGAFSRAD